MADLEAIAGRLATEVERALGPWVRRRLDGLDPADVEHVVAAVERVVLPDLRAALERDVDTPGPSPLAIVRRAVGPVTEALRAAGAQPLARDRQQVELFPDDVYDVVPASFADLSPAAGEAGIAWGAARAFVHLERRRSER